MYVCIYVGGYMYIYIYIYMAWYGMVWYQAWRPRA